MEPLILGLGGLIFAAVTLAVMGVRTALTRESAEVLERVARGGSTDAGGSKEEVSLFASLLRPLAKLARPKEATSDLSRVKEQLTWAGLRSDFAAEGYFGAKIVLAVLLSGGILGLSGLLPEPIEDVELMAVILAAIGYYLPNAWLKGKVKERQTAIQRALPDALDLLVTSVEAGLGLEAAINRITREIVLSAPILASELQRSTQEMQAGVTRADAFRRLAERTGLEELRSLSAMLIQSEMFGTSIARSLRVHSSGMRVKRMHRAEEKAATVAVKMLLPLVLFILPSLFAVILGPAVVRIIQVLLPSLGGSS
jgi:tight adherence protein C